MTSTPRNYHCVNYYNLRQLVFHLRPGDETVCSREWRWINFSKPVPLPDAGKFAFVGEASTGVRVFTAGKRAVTLGVRFHHISNGNRSGSNRGLNQFVIYAGFSVFK